MKVGLIISNDWELFGNGAGDYFEAQHHPLEQLLNTVENHGAKLTVMAEIGQQWAHQRVGASESWAQEITSAWDDILQETVRKKFDVQLHFHPQWLGAKFKDDKWHVEPDKIAMTSLSSDEMDRVLERGKRDLEQLLRPIEPNYACIAFRSGWYCMQPSDVITQSLLKAGIICDTSVVKGAYKQNLYDYRGAYSNCIPWFANPDDIRFKNETQFGLFEIPIYSYDSLSFPLFRKLNYHRLYHIFSFRIKISKDDQRWLVERHEIERQRRLVRGHQHILSTVRKKSFIEKIMYYLSQSPVSKKTFRLDYDNLPSDVFVKMIQHLFETKPICDERGQEEVILPVMASGHVKRMHNCDNINRIFDKLHDRFKDRVFYWTLSEAIHHFLHSADVAAAPFNSCIE